MNKKEASPSVCVVIPVYKNTLSLHETIALTQCVRVLGHYPMALVCPVSLNMSGLTNQFPVLQVYTFDDLFFTDVQAYNRLMLSDLFYKRFAQFEFILIHQLDAFVFHDDLLAWCCRGYDYVGAPWLRDQDFGNWPAEIWFNLKRRVATWLHLKKADGVTPREIVSLNQVGNGGLSLRRVSAMRRALQQHRQQLQTYQKQLMHQYNEDVFFGIEVNRFWPHLRIPDYRTALQFAIEFYPKRAIETYNEGQLPFGCHAWNRHDTAYWRPIFAQLGYQI